MVRGYHVYNADICMGLCCWRGIPAGWQHTRRLLLLSELGLFSSVALPTVSISSQANGCRWVHWNLVGCSKARSTVTNALLAHCFYVFDCLFKFDVKISTVKIFIFVSRGFIRNVQHFAL